MIRKHFRFKRLVLGLALGLVLAVVAVPTASAKPVNSNVSNGGLDPWAVNLVYKSTHPTATKTVDLGPLDPWAYNLVYQSRYIGNASAGDTAIRVSNPSSGFDFSDAGIGAAVSFGVSLILLTGVGLTMRQRRSHRSGLAIS